MFKIPKNDSRYYWTNHVIRKMAFYGLSPDRVKRVIRNPKRIEEGIAENTIAVMMPGTNKKKPSEIWVMYQEVRRKRASDNSRLSIDHSQKKKVIISAWRYPGVSPIGQQIPIPQNILEELKKEGIIQ